jgi:tripeptide aminopeptidase
MSDVVERFMRYVQVDSQSDPMGGGQTPSTACQHEMARLLEGELADLGCEDVRRDGHAYVTAGVPASKGAEALPALGLIAHVDTAPAAPASGVAPHVVRYEGGDLVAGMVDGVPVSTTTEQCSDLDLFRGQDIVCSDGRTLLSGDDKAGVAEICALVARLKADPSLAHPALRVAFVPDEEIGHGARLLELHDFGATWAYTVDGEALGEVSYETFNAAQADVSVTGVMVHPGSAKGVMVNAITVLHELDAMLPAWERPEHTEGYEGFFHCIGIEGTESGATASYILRDFEAAGLERRKREMRDAAAFLNARHGAGTVSVAVRDEYRNMAECFDGIGFLVENALAANREAGIEPVVRAIRGGTDGSQLTFRGLPCPNLATGTYQAHSVREFVPVASLEATVDMLEHLVAKFAVAQR